MKALILAAGYATRLYPLTRDYPKPLLKVGSRPIIEHIIAGLDRIEELEGIVVVTNSKFISVFRQWADGLRTAKPLSLVDDLTQSPQDRLGAIGDIDFAIKSEGIKEDLLVIGGDNLFDSDLNGFLAFARSHKPAPSIGAYDIKDLKEAKKYGLVRLDNNNKVIDFQEKPESPGSTLAAMCLYYFPGDKLGLVGEYLNDKSCRHDATGFYISWLSRRQAVYAFVFGGRWYDIGHHKFYNEARTRFSKS